MYSEKNQLAKLDPSERHYCPQNHSSTKSQLTKYSLDSTGPKEAKQGLLVIYDIFGFFPQTIQGADILAYSDSEHPYQVFIPDFFEVILRTSVGTLQTTKRKGRSWESSSRQLPRLQKPYHECRRLYRSWPRLGV